MANAGGRELDQSAHCALRWGEVKLSQRSSVPFQGCRSSSNKSLADAGRSATLNANLLCWNGNGI